MSDEWRAELLAVYDAAANHDMSYDAEGDGVAAVARHVLRDPHRFRQLLGVPYPAVEVYPPVPNKTGYVSPGWEVQAMHESIYTPEPPQLLYDGISTFSLCRHCHQPISDPAFGVRAVAGGFVHMQCPINTEDARAIAARVSGGDAPIYSSQPAEPWVGTIASPEGEE